MRRNSSGDSKPDSKPNFTSTKEINLTSDDDNEEKPDYYYSVLGISRDATPDDVRMAYRRLCVIYHPDKHIDPHDKAAAHRFFALLHRAYVILSDNQLRSLYNQFGRRGAETAMQLGPLMHSDIERLRRELAKNLTNNSSSLGRWNHRSVLATDVDASAWYEDWEALGEQITWLDYLPTICRFAGTHRAEGVFGNGWTASLLLSMANGPEAHQLFSGGGSSVAGGSISGQLTRQISQRTCWRGDLALAVGSRDHRKAGTGISLALTRKMSLDLYLAGLVDTEGSGGMFRVHPHVQASLSHLLGERAVLTSTIISSGVGVIACEWHHESIPSSLSLHIRRHPLNGMLFMGGIEGKTVWHVDRLHSLKFKFSSASPIQLSLGIVRRLQAKAFSTDDEEADEEEQNVLHWGPIPKVGCTLEAGLQWGVGLKISYAPDEEIALILPIYISRQLSQYSLLLGVAIPSLVVALTYNLVFLPWQRRRRRDFWLAFHEEQKYRIEQRKEEAQSAIDMMADYLQKHPPQGDFLIRRAIYTVATEEKIANQQRLDQFLDGWDVTLPMQLFVFDNQIQLAARQTYALFLGFYDPAPGLAKELRIEYSFKGQEHQVILRDGQAIYLPQRAHIIIA